MLQFLGLALLGLTASRTAHAQTVNLDPSIFYTVTFASGKDAGCNPLNSMLSNRGCDSPVVDLWNKDDESRNQRYRFIPVAGQANVFNILTGCSKYLSVQACGGANKGPDTYGFDMALVARGVWVLTPVSGASNTYTIRVAGGRDASCGTFLSTGAGCTDSYVDLFTSDDGSGRQRWVLKPVQNSEQGSLPLVPFKYKALPLGAVKPMSGSWLLRQLQQQADGLHGHLQDFWDPIQNSKWLGGGGDYSDLNEAGSYWLNGVIPAAFQLNDQRLIGAVGSWMKYIVDHQGSDGWIGPSQERRALWGRYPALLAMMQYAQVNATASPVMVNSMQKFLIGLHDSLTKNGGRDHGLEEWSIMRWQDVSVAIHWLIENHPNGQEATYSNLLKLIRHGGANWKQIFSEGSFPTSAVNHVDIRHHGVNVVQAIKSEAVAYRFTHDQSDVDSTRKRVELIEKYHGGVSGVLAADEHLAGLHPARGAELCTVVEQMYSFEYLYSLLGDNQYADKIERLAYNALPGTMTDDMWAHQYLQQSNQPWARHMDPSVFATDGPDSNTFGVAPNYPCCTVNHGQGWPKFISHAFMISSDASTLYHVLLSPTTVSTTLSGNNGVTVTAQTNYPFNSQLQYTTSGSQAFNFGIRVPAWVSGSVTYSVDGASEQGTANADGYIIINVPTGSHKIDINIPMAVRTQSGFNGSKAVLRGPLVYSADIAFSTTVLSSGPLNSRDLRFDPTSPWAFAIGTSSLKYNGDATALQDKVWSSGGSPVSISADACPVNWNVVTNTADAPPSSPASCAAAKQKIRLIPYGAAKLRMTEMPTY